MKTLFLYPCRKRKIPQSLAVKGLGDDVPGSIRTCDAEIRRTALGTLGCPSDVLQSLSINEFNVSSVYLIPRVGTYPGLKIVELRRPARRPVGAGCARVCGGRESEQGPGRSPRKFLHHGPKPDEEAGEPGIERLRLGRHLVFHGLIRTFTIGIGIRMQFFWVGHNSPSGSATESPVTR